MKKHDTLLRILRANELQRQPYKARFSVADIPYSLISAMKEA